MALWLLALQPTFSAGIITAGIVMFAGTVLEGLADHQKQRSKEAAPERFVAVGLFARWRHPNYLGEILFQLGLIIVAVTSALTADDLVAGLISPLYIVILMISEARRVDDYQITRYGSETTYLDYRARSGSLWPKVLQ
jgi:steroid 5-alpha reductase family enzyme